MNPRVERLPKWGKFPVPFFVTYMKDGTPDFKITNERNRQRCAMENLCWICGEKLDYWIVFIGGDLSVKNRLFTDGPMHEECAIDAMIICPFLVGSTDYAPPKTFRFDKHKKEDKIHSFNEIVAVRDKPPERNALYKTRGYMIVQAPDGRGWFFHAHKSVSVRWTKRGEAFTNG